VNSIPKPKEEKKARPDNIKIDNITIDGDSDVNWEDFIKVNQGGDEETVGEKEQKEETE